MANASTSETYHSKHDSMNSYDLPCAFHCFSGNSIITQEISLNTALNVHNVRHVMCAGLNDFCFVLCASQILMSKKHFTSMLSSAALGAPPAVRSQVSLLVDEINAMPAPGADEETSSAMLTDEDLLNYGSEATVPTKCVEHPDCVRRPDFISGKHRGYCVNAAGKRIQDVKMGNDATEMLEDTYEPARASRSAAAKAPASAAKAPASAAKASGGKRKMSAYELAQEEAKEAMKAQQEAAKAAEEAKAKLAAAKDKEKNDRRASGASKKQRANDIMAEAKAQAQKVLAEAKAKADRVAEDGDEDLRAADLLSQEADPF